MAARGESEVALRHRTSALRAILAVRDRLVLLAVVTRARAEPGTAEEATGAIELRLDVRGDEAERRRQGGHRQELGVAVLGQRAIRRSAERQVRRAIEQARELLELLRLGHFRTGERPEADVAGTSVRSGLVE